jgi:DNA-directed RNA polymerase
MAWQPGNNPQGHPLWERQVSLEMEMLEAGRDAYRASMGKANDLGEMTRIGPYRRLMEKMVNDMGVGLKAWLNYLAKAARSGDAGSAPQAYARLKGFDPFLAAYITLRTVIDGLGATGNNKRTVGKSAISMASSIGVTLEYEGRMNAWMSSDAKLFHGTQKKLKTQKATDKHKKRVNINRFNALMREKLDWADWTGDERKHVGLKLLDIMCRTTGQFTIEEDPLFIRKDKNIGRLMVRPSDELTQHLVEAVERDQLRTPHYMPTLMPPKRWDGVRNGGYYTPLVRAPRLISFKAENEETQGAAMDEYDALDMPNVYAALAAVQEVPWRINQKVLAVVLEAWDRDLGLGKMMKRELDPLPKRPAGMHRVDLKGPEKRSAELAWAEENPLAALEWKRSAAIVYGKNARRTSNSHAVLTTIMLAEKFRNDEFYFPHMLDFRGRMYPIPAYLQPQGNDLARGLLTFGKGRAITEENGGAGWLAIHLANVWGNDKISYDERIKWVGDNDDLWLSIYENPLGNLEWTTNKGKPRKDAWQALAAIFEWVRFRIEGFGMVSSLPVRVDGTCNGIQHLSAMMRDEVGGASVNLLASPTPRDIYKEVAEQLQAKIEGIQEAGGRPGELAGAWLNTFENTIPRAFTKNPVMVLPYGGTKESYYGSISKWIREEATTGLPEADHKAAVPWMVSNLWDSVNGVVVQGRVCMEWLKSCARAVAEVNQPILWTTRTGFHVRHFYGHLEERRIKTLIDGKEVQFVCWERTKKLAKRDQLQGISPNFVHSQDAAVNMETILMFMAPNEEGTTPPFTSIHDAFGTCAADMWPLFRHIREAFIMVHEEDVLTGFRNKCVEMLRDHLYTVNNTMTLEDAWEKAEDTIPPVPPRGNLDLNEVRNADYFFA